MILTGFFLMWPWPALKLASWRQVNHGESHGISETRLAQTCKACTAEGMSCSQLDGIEERPPRGLSRDLVGDFGKPWQTLKTAPS